MMDALDQQRRRISQQNHNCVQRQSSDDQGLNESIPLTHHSQRNPPAGSSSAAPAVSSPSSSSSAPPANGCHSSANNNQNNHRRHHRRPRQHDSIDTQMERQASVDLPGNALDPRNSQIKHLRRERRAVKTLGAIMIAFLICWLPFFVRYSACEPNRCNWKFMPIVEDIVFWVGYFNSMINP